MTQTMKKIPYGVKAKAKNSPKSEMDEVAIWSEKGIPFQSPNGKIWLISVDDAGELTTVEVTE